MKKKGLWSQKIIHNQKIILYIKKKSLNSPKQYFFFKYKFHYIDFFLFSILNQIYLFSLFWYAVLHDSMQSLVIGKFGTIFLGAKQLYIKTLLLLGLWLRTQEKKWSRQMNNATSQIRSADRRGRKWETILPQTVLLIDVSWTQSHTYGEKVRKWESEKESWFEWKTTYPLISPHERGIFPRLLSLIW